MVRNGQTCFASAEKNGAAAATRDEDGKNGVLSTRMDALGFDTTSALTPPTTTTKTAGGGGVECIDVTMASATGFAGNDASSIRPSGPQDSGRLRAGANRKSKTTRATTSSSSGSSSRRRRRRA